MSPTEHRYFTTPIYYANGDLHEGHFYSTLIVNVLSAHYRQRGMQVLSLTGMDEHGEKVEEVARKQGLAPQAFVDNVATRWKGQLAELSLVSDIFMRTTSPEHAKNVRQILERCYANGDIYFGEHAGHYCVGCEAFLTPSQMDENKNCLDHQRPTELRKEKNYFFRTTKYRDKVIELLKSGTIISNPRYINELVAVAQGMEGDLSISRPKTRTTWGHELPFDPEHVTYVWFDALPNYVTGVGGVDAARTSPYWANCHHVLGKEITRFHAIFWPAMLMSLNLPIPKLLITGWLLSDSLKISKSLGNATRLHAWGRDAFTNAVLRVTNPGEDLEVQAKTVVERFNADLANGIGNLLARTLGMIEKSNDKCIPAFHEECWGEAEQNLANIAGRLPNDVCAAMDAFRLADALSQIWTLIAATDKYISDKKPWALAKDPAKRHELEDTLAHAVASLRTVGLLAVAFFPEKMTELLLSIGEDANDLTQAVQRAREYRNIRSGHIFTEIPKLYMRIETSPEAPAQEATPQKVTKAPKEAPAPETKLPEGVISIDDFSKVDIRVGTVLLAEFVPGSDKLLHIKVSLGELGVRTVFAGIRQWVKPEDVTNRKLLVVANLAPRKMKFGISEGMILATDTNDGSVSPIYVPENLKEGARLG